jgi:hypothetical protein
MKCVHFASVRKFDKEYIMYSGVTIYPVTDKVSLPDKSEIYFGLTNEDMKMFLILDDGKDIYVFGLEKIRKDIPEIIGDILSQCNEVTYFNSYASMFIQRVFSYMEHMIYEDTQRLIDHGARLSNSRYDIKPSLLTNRDIMYEVKDNDKYITYTNYYDNGIFIFRVDSEKEHISFQHNGYYYNHLMNHIVSGLDAREIIEF